MHKKYHEKMWNNTDKAYLKFINNCVIIILQIAIDCKTKRICQDYLKEQADCRDGKRKLKKTQAVLYEWQDPETKEIVMQSAGNSILQEEKAERDYFGYLMYTIRLF